MSGKSFILLLIGVVAIGAALAGAAIAVSTLGGDEEPPSQALLTAPAAAGVGRQAEQSPPLQSSQPAAPLATTGEPRRFAGGAANVLAGTLQEVEGNSLTLETLDGPVTAIVEEGAAMNLFLEVPPGDLEEGMRVTVIGERGEDGITKATSILVLTENEGGGLGGAAGVTGVPSSGLGQFTGQPFPAQLSPEERAEIRDQIQRVASSGDASQLPPELAQRLRGLAGQSGAEPGFGRGGGLTGAIEAISGNLITIETPRGPLRATLGDETAIRKTASEGALSDFPIGSQVRLIGQTTDDGVFHATGVFMVPEGLGDGFGSFGGPGRPGAGQPPAPGASSP